MSWSACISLALCLISVSAQVETDWWQSAVVYQIYPRSFQDYTDVSSGRDDIVNDGIGDLQGIRTRLNYLQSLGIECIWLSPIFKSPMKDFGYDVQDFKDVDPIFGTLADFDELMADLKARGMYLVMDIVPNHTSDLHEWFEKSVAREDPYTDYFTWADPAGIDGDGNPIPPSNWLSVFRGSAWTWNEQRQQFYLHQFLKEQPDINPFSSLLQTELEDVLRFWLDKGVDGFRVDAIKHMFEVEDVYQDEPLSGITDDPDDYNYLLHTLTIFQPQTLQILRRWRLILDEYSLQAGYPKVMMTEVTGGGLPNDNELLMAYYGTVDEPIAHFTFNFRFIEQLRTPLNAATVRNTINGWFRDMPQFGWANWVIGNHDVFRVGSRFGEEYIDAINMIVQLVPGTAVTYQGEEIGMLNNMDISYEDTQDPAGCNCGPDRYQECSRDPERTPFQWDNSPFGGFTQGDSTWLPVNDNYVTINAAAQEMTLESHLKVYRQLVAQRKTAVTQTRKYDFPGPVNTDDIFVMTREEFGEAIAVVVNFSNESRFLDLTASLPLVAEVVTRSVNTGGGDITFPGREIFTDAIPIGPAEGLVLSYRPTRDS